MKTPDHKQGRKRRQGERGGVMIEFTLVSALFTVPILMGVLGVGLNLARGIQSTQVARDAGHMYARQVDFSLNENKDIIVRLTEGLGMTWNGGEGVVILSRVYYVGDADCAGAGLTNGACTNLDQYVFRHRVVIGNPALRASYFGAPNAGLVQSNGDVTNWLTDMGARASNFAPLLPLSDGEEAWVTEAFFEGAPGGAAGVVPITGVYSRTIF